MRLSVEHRTTYRFTAPQGRIVQLLRMTPEDSHDQTVAAWRIDVDCDARLREHRDGFGNLTTMLYVEGPVDDIEIAVSGEVVTSASGGIVHGALDPLPPALFLRSTALTMPDAALTSFAHDAGSGPNAIGRLHALNRAVNARFALDRDRGDAARTVAEAFGGATATARDMAHVFVAAARALGVPARFVSGYSAVAGDHRPSPHSWAEGFVEGVGWVGFDPTIAQSPEDRHIRVAVALDAYGATAVAGSRLGEGRECLDVDVTVQRED
jgi:transglutaminase-like putative cysteine protease